MSAGALPRRRIGTTAVEVTVLGLGGAPLGNLFEEIPAERALATVRAALDAGIGWFDVAPFYGHGLAEHRFGHVLREAPRDAFVLSTKTGRLLRAADARAIDPSPFKGRHHFAVAHDYSYDATMRSLEDSLQRLGMGRIDVALIHDVDPMHQGDAYEARFAEAVGGACRALADAKAAGAIGAWGIGVNQVEPCLRFAREADLDCVMLARCYTLLEQEGVPELLDLARGEGLLAARRGALRLGRPRQRRGGGGGAQLRRRLAGHARPGTPDGGGVRPPTARRSRPRRCTSPLATCTSPRWRPAPWRPSRWRRTPA